MLISEKKTGRVSEDEINVMEEKLDPDAERVINGLRDTGYTFNTAMADIIDNSIAADATKIDITINLNPKNGVTIYVSDNGIGMDADGLRNAMRYGSNKREDAASLGKFGLGLKTASTAFCRCLSVVSRGAGDSTVRKVQWDLDYVAKKNQWLIKHLGVTEDELGLLDETADGGTGTLVIWEKVDRLLKSYINTGSERKALKRIVDDLRFHISMVYQRFLDPEDNRERTVQISLDGEPVEAWDPFCLKEEMTECVAEDTIGVVFEEDERPSSFTVKAYVTPRAEEFSTPEARKKAKGSNNDMQGFYVYRENRLIHYGDWLGMYSREPHGSLLRVEFSFDHTLDDAFNVDIKKSRIILNEEIFDYLKNSFLPAPRHAADERYRKGERKEVAKKGKNAHDASNKNIDSKADELDNVKTTVTGKDEVELTNQRGTFNHKITIRPREKDGQCRIVPVESIDDGLLWRPCIVEGNKAIELNQGHPYYQKVYYPVLSQNVMVTGMDSLLWAFGMAELETVDERTADQYEELRYRVSRTLKKLVADLPDPDINRDNDQ